jgi:hypothetical protein
LTCWLFMHGWQGYAHVRDEYIRGLDYIVGSMTLFVLALAVSLAKSGLLWRWWTRWRKAPEPTDEW